MTIKEVIYTPDNTLLIPSDLCRSIRMEIRRESSPSCGASYLRVSVVVLLSVAVLDRDPWSTQPCPPIWACICGADQRSALYLSACRRGGINDQRVLPASNRV